jgi:hypothetical protein
MSCFRQYLPGGLKDSVCHVADGNLAGRISRRNCSNANVPYPLFLYTVEAGFNWYLNQYVKVNFTWQHAVFGNPVQDSPTMMRKTSDLFLLRCQLYF